MTRTEHRLLYHGTTAEHAERILAAGFGDLGAIRRICDGVADRYSINRDVLWHHPWNEFGRCRAHRGDSNVYLTAERQVAETYARIGSEPLNDALRCAYRILNDADVNRDGFYCDATTWARTEAAAHTEPVIITVAVPVEILAAAGLDPDHLGPTVALPAPLPEAWIVTIEPLAAVPATC